MISIKLHWGVVCKLENISIYRNEIKYRNAGGRQIGLWWSQTDYKYHIIIFKWSSFKIIWLTLNAPVFAWTIQRETLQQTSLLESKRSKFRTVEGTILSIEILLSPFLFQSLTLWLVKHSGKSLCGYQAISVKCSFATFFREPNKSAPIYTYRFVLHCWWRHAPV